MATKPFTPLTLQRAPRASWQSGLANLWRKETRRWWQTWLWQLLIWVPLLDGFTAIAGASSRSSASSGSSGSMLVLVFLFFMLFSSFGTVIMTHGKLLDEQQSGTMAWILSKPVTRSAFLLSKLASLPGMLLMMTLIPGVIAYQIMWLFQGQMVSLGTFLLMLVFNACSITFFFCVTLLLGVLAKRRAVILGLGLFLCFVIMQVLFNNNTLALVLLEHVLWLQLAAVTVVLLALLCFLLTLARFTHEEF